MMPLSRFAVVLLALGVSGCGLLGGRSPVVVPAAPGAPAVPEAPAAPTRVQLSGDASMNAGGNAARVYLYPLSSDATFLSTPVQVFWENPAETLAADLVGPVRDVTVRPGEVSTLDELPLGDAAFVGIAADLRTPQGTSWRTVRPAADVRGTTFRVTVTESGIQVAP